jgi:Holliday junction resolvase-like predicted endonuclease
MPYQTAGSAAISSHHVGVAAEAFAAGQFARCGFDVSVQYGANQPEYDLMVAKGTALLKVSVKGSQDGSWGLTQSFLEHATKRSGKKADYHGAIDIWLERHGSRTVLCLVQFAGVPSNLLPRMYLATPIEVARRLRETAKGRGDSILYENQEWTSRAHGAGTVDKIPDNWRFTRERAEELLENKDVSVTTSQTLT